MFFDNNTFIDALEAESEALFCSPVLIFIDLIHSFSVGVRYAESSTCLLDSKMLFVDKFDEFLSLLIV